MLDASVAPSTFCAPRPSVRVIVLNWNSKADTIACLAALADVDYPHLHVAVVDNGSVDGSAALIREQNPDVEILETGRNLGYAGGNNVGLRHFLDACDDDFFLVLNNDTVMDTGCVTALVDFAAVHPDTGIFGPTIYCHDRPDRLWFAGARWTGSNFVHVGYEERDEDLAPIATQPPAFITGCALFVRREVLLRVGLLDERFFLLFEDVDFCYRARRLGFRCALVSNARLWHKASSSIGTKGSPLPSYFYLRNRLLFGAIHLPIIQKLSLMVTAFWELVFPNLLLVNTQDAALLKRMYWLFRKHELFHFEEYSSPAYRAGLRGTLDFFLGRFGDCPPYIRIDQKAASSSAIR